MNFFTQQLYQANNLAPQSATSLPYLCSEHSEPLLAVLKGGAGYCPQCRLFVQSSNHPMPTLDVHVQAKREAAAAAKASRKRGGKIAAKTLPAVVATPKPKARLIKKNEVTANV